MGSVEFLLACHDAGRKTILSWRQRTGGEVGEGARRVVGLVEIDDDLALPIGCI